MKAIQDGVIQRVSPSMLTTFDSTSAFGCARRGYFKYVEGIKEPTTDAMTVGTHLHAMNEEYLRTGKLLLGTEEQTAWFRAGQKYLDSIRDAVSGIERPMPEGFAVEGIPVSEMSKCDVVTEAGIIDWKTTSSIEKYGKTPGALAKDVQMLIYAQAFHTTAQEVSLTHGQYQTKGKPLFFESTVKLSRKELDANYGRVIKPLVATVRDVAQQKEAKAVPPNRNACRLCPHKAICPEDKENPIMSIFNKFRTPAAAPAPILPPDAPKSDPALAAKPVDGFQAVPPPRKMLIEDVVPEPAPTAPATPVAKAEAAPPPPPAPAPVIEEPKKRAGRPPGSKNKPKDEVIVYNPAAVAVVSSPDNFLFESVTVNYGVTVNMGNFNNVKIDVSMTARHGGDADAAYAKVMDAVKAKVEAEMELLKQVK